MLYLQNGYLNGKGNWIVAGGAQTVDRESHVGINDGFCSLDCLMLTQDDTDPWLLIRPRVRGSQVESLASSSSPRLHVARIKSSFYEFAQKQDPCMGHEK